MTTLTPMNHEQMIINMLMSNNKQLVISMLIINNDKQYIKQLNNEQRQIL